MKKEEEEEEEEEGGKEYSAGINTNNPPDINVPLHTILVARKPVDCLWNKNGQF